MASQVDVCNMALALLGQSTSIASLNDPNRAARLCKRFFAIGVDAFLRAYDWNAATRRAPLNRDATAPTFGFAYSYTLPTDCLRVVEMEDEDAVYKVEGRHLLTDEDQVNIKYIARIGVGEFDSLMTASLAAYLAADLALPLTSSTTTQKNMVALFEAKRDEAQSIDSREGTAEKMDQSTWLESRY